MLVPALLACGCASGFGPRAKYGITFYVPGAGNVDMGDAGLRRGLEQAGYRGQVSRLTWTFSLNPAIDQAVRVNAKLGAQRLAGYIEDYIDTYPGREVNLVGLSAGSGVAVWALESLKPGYEIDTLVLLASSLSSDYDISRALKRVRGNVYCYYSPNDVVLTLLMKPVGTIDGKIMTDGAGAVGLHPPRGGDRVVNIRWRPEFRNYGYSGGHTDVTSPEFVRRYVARHLVTAQSAGLLEDADTRRVVAMLRGGAGDGPAAADDRPHVASPREVRARLLAADAALDQEVTRGAIGQAPMAAPNGSYERLKRVLAGERPITPVSRTGYVPSEVAAAERLLDLLDPDSTDGRVRP